MPDYEPGRYTGFKNFVYWMATKRRNWLAGGFVLVYWLVTAVAFVVAIVNPGARSILPWAIGLGVLGFVVDVLLAGLSLHWNFPLVPERKRNQST